MLISLDFVSIQELVIGYSIIDSSFSFPFELIFWVDKRSVIFFLTVVCISSVIIIFINFYMGTDYISLGRFTKIVISFVLSMVVLIFRGNFITALVGWDGLGVVSFVLVIYYHRKVGIISSLLTVLVNRLGDVAIIITIVLFLHCDITITGFFLTSDSNILAVLLVLGRITKRAQFPFSSWLPAAITAPTPVSSLVHRSTLVTAGVYLMYRINYLLLESMLGFWLTTIGLFTIFLGGLMALYEVDVKKIVAFSTLSQLGLIITVLGVGEISLSFLHLLIHALFKSIIFVICGYFIICNFGNQDGRYFSVRHSMFKYMQVLLGVSCLSLIGFPLTLGFVSKDLILEGFISTGISTFIILVFYINCIFTALYGLKILFGGLSFVNWGSPILVKASTSGSYIVFPLFLLCITIGMIMEEYFVILDFSIRDVTLKLLDYLIVMLGVTIWFGLLSFSFSSRTVVSSFFFLDYFISFLRVIYYK